MGEFLCSPYELIYKDFMDFIDQENTIWIQNEYGIKVNNNEIESYSSNFKEISKFNTYHRNDELTITHSFSNKEGTTIFKHLIEINNKKIIEKFVSEESSNELQKFLNIHFIKEKNTKIVLFNIDHPTYIFKSTNKEYLSIIYEEELYFEILRYPKGKLDQ